MAIECHSGGATGADYAWIKLCEHFKIPSHVFSFLGHRGFVVPEGHQFCKIYTFNDRELSLGHQPLLKANETLRRVYPNNSHWINRLLRRNYMIVRRVDQVFGVGTLNKAKTIVDGGTGWGIQMGIDLGLDVYVYEQDLKAWCRWVDHQFVTMFDPPIIKGTFAGIGSRHILPDDVKAMADLLRRSVLDENDNACLRA